MIRRLFWLALGATVGVLVVRKAGQVAQPYTPQGIAGNLGEGLSGLGDGLREWPTWCARPWPSARRCCAPP